LLAFVNPKSFDRLALYKNDLYFHSVSLILFYFVFPPILFSEITLTRAMEEKKTDKSTNPGNDNGFTPKP